jgi:GNAT superfamily N-acetyltransferase
MPAICPLTPARWKDLEALFGERGACGGCWCMFWRLPRAVFERQKGSGNRQAFRRRVQKGDPPGLIAYDGRTPVGWCAVAPRAQYPALARSRILQPVDGEPVWSVSCLFVARPYRRRGVSKRLLEAAADYVRRRGGRIVEGYPVEPKEKKVADAFVWTGLASAFRQAGFHEVARRSQTRPIMRRDLR